MEFFSREMIIGVVFILGGVMLKFYPPKKINALYGYRTRMSMKNARNWEEGNKLSAKFFLLSGCLNILVDLTLLVIMPSDIAIRIIVCLTLMIITVILMFIITEKKLKEIDRINN